MVGGIDQIIAKLEKDSDPFTKDTVRTLRMRKVDATSHVRMRNVLRDHGLIGEVEQLEEIAEDFIDPDRVTMAVVVMPMLDFDVSYVLFGIEPRSTLMKSIFAVYGTIWLLLIAAFAFNLSWSHWAMLIAAGGAIWYLPFGTLLSVLQIVLLLLLPRTASPGS